MLKRFIVLIAISMLIVSAKAQYPTTEIRLVKIYDVTGKMVAEGNLQNNRMEISSLSQGYYLASYETNSGNGIKRFIKAE